MTDAAADHPDPDPDPDPEPLTPLDEDWARMLAVVAHPDDLEYGAAAAVARWTGQGREVVYCMVTSGEAGIDAMEPERARGVREAEEVESARRVGVETVDFLGLPDGTLQHDLVLRRAVAGAIRRHRPQVVLTVNSRDTWDGADALNQADHIATGRAVLDAVRDAANRWVFPDEGPGRWDGVRQVWASNSPRAGHGVDTTDTFQAGVASLEAHRAYLDGLGDQRPDPRTMLAAAAEPAGVRLGCRYGAAFEVFRP